MEIVPSTFIYLALFVLKLDIFLAVGEFNETHVDPGYLETLFSSGQYKEFSKLFQIEDVNLVKLGKVAKGSELDDVILRPWQREQGRQGLNFGTYPSSKWENNTVPYVILPEGYSENNLLTISTAINTFNSQVQNIQYQRRNNEEDYVVFFTGNGCYSNLGRVGGQQAISLRASGCMREGIILHEMIHTIGITHEHERADRDEYVRILYENIPEDWHENYEKYSTEVVTSLGKYDYYSLMHYPLKAPETRKPAFEILQQNIDLKRIGQRLAMTLEDVAKINELYT